MQSTHAETAHVGTRLADLQTGGVLFGAVLFNAVLALINAQVMPLSPAVVIASESMIVAAAHLVAVLHFKARMAPWYVLIGALVAFALFRSAAIGAPDVKYLRDVLLIPTFIILGMSFSRARLPQILVAIQLIVLGFALLEAISVEHFSELFAIKSYYINTRGYTEQDFWNTGSDLFVSASRPSDRFFAFVDLHRMSSIFLEPVSLGNYCVIIFAYALASFRELTIMQRIILLGGTLALMIGCDGRLAAVSCAVIAVAALIAPRLPQRALIAVPFVVLVAGAAAVSFLGLKAGEDDFAGRLAHTFALLASYGPAEYFGISNVYLPQAVDSGLAYLISTQSLFGVILLWLFVAGFAEERTRQQVVYKTGVVFYLALSMLVSFSFLSIKTASLLWFILGAMHTGALAPLRPPLPARYWRVPIPARPEGGRFG